jgi:MFS family permease
VSGGADRATFRGVFTVPEFRALWLAQVLSVTGDQVARVALTLLVYGRTRSAALAAVTFVMGMLPSFLGGLLLSGLGDRLPRRAVMIGCDLARAALVAIMTVPGLPLAALVGLLFAVTALQAPFISARSAVYPEILSGSRYVTATAITLTTSQAAQVAGFAAGGTIAGSLGVRVSLFIDAGTFIASALLVRFGAAARPLPPASAVPRRVGGFPPLAGIRLVFTDPALRTPMLLAWLAAFYNAPEGVATPFARQLGGGPATVGLLLAAPALGYALAALAFGKLARPAAQERLMSVLPLACCVLLIPIALRPPLAVTLLILTASGACACFQVAANATFVAAAPAQRRSQATGLAIAGLTLGQGIAMVAAGAAAQRFTPAAVIAAAGAVGAVAAAMLGIQHRAYLAARDAAPPSSAPG